MPILAILSGAALTALGPIFYLIAAPGQRHFTAFIPSLFGIMVLACGLAAQNLARRKMAMHAAVGIALLGGLGALFMGGPQWPALLSGNVVYRPLAATAMLVMFLICAVFVALSIGQFIRMRRV